MQKYPYPTPNGMIYKWGYCKQTAIFEWDEDYKNGSHYHCMMPEWNNKHDESEESHFKAGMVMQNHEHQCTEDINFYNNFHELTKGGYVDLIVDYRNSYLINHISLHDFEFKGIKHDYEKIYRVRNKKRVRRQSHLL